MNKTAVLYSHGFGVEKTSFGLFEDISISLSGVDHFMFNYYTHRGSQWYVHGLDDMSNTLRNHFQKLHEKYENIIIISHSQGCTISALAQLRNVRHIFLAPPTRSITDHFKEHFVSRRKDRARIDDKGNVHLIRKRDGQELIISNEWFDEMVGNDSFDSMREYAKSGILTIVEALQDKDIKDRRRYERLVKDGAQLHSINGSHNFDEPDRHLLLDVLSKVV